MFKKWPWNSLGWQMRLFMACEPKENKKLLLCGVGSGNRAVISFTWELQWQKISWGKLPLHECSVMKHLTIFTRWLIKNCFIRGLLVKIAEISCYTNTGLIKSTYVGRQILSRFLTEHYIKLGYETLRYLQDGCSNTNCFIRETKSWKLHVISIQWVMRYVLSPLWKKNWNNENQRY